mgnify:CR=1 FL=1
MRPPVLTPNPHTPHTAQARTVTAPSRPTPGGTGPVPLVTGPYTSGNCSLSRQKSSTRTKADVGLGYARTGANDSRFNDYY